MAIKTSLNDGSGGKGTGRQTRAIVRDIEANFNELKFVGMNRVNLREYELPGSTLSNPATSAAVFNRAIADVTLNKKVLVTDNGLYRHNSPILLPANAQDLVWLCDPRARFERLVNTVGSSGSLANADTTGAGTGATRPRRIFIRGGEWGVPYTPNADGSAVATVTGNLWAFVADEVVAVDVRMAGLGPSGRFYAGGGNIHRIVRPWLNYSNPAAGSGGWRILFGDDIQVTDGFCQAGDDIWQVVQAENGPYSNKDVGTVVFRDCSGRSWAARFLVVGITDQVGGLPTYSCSTKRVDFINCRGGGTAFAAYVANESSTGQIEEVNITDCVLTDYSPDGATTTPGGILLNAIPLAGQPEGNAIGTVRVRGTVLRNAQKTPFQCQGNVGKVILEDHDFKTPRGSDGVTVLIKQAKEVEIRRGRINASFSQNGYQFGTPTTEVKSLVIDGAEVNGLVDPGAGIFSYGYNITNVKSGKIINRSTMKLVAPSVQVRSLSIGPNSTNILVDSLDMREITATNPIVNSSNSVIFGSDILTFNGSLFKERFSSQSASDTLFYQEGLVFVRMTGTGTVTKLLPDNGLIKGAHFCALVQIGPGPITIAKQTVGNGGNFYGMAADIVLGADQSVLFVYNPINTRWHLISKP